MDGRKYIIKGQNSLLNRRSTWQERKGIKKEYCALDLTNLERILNLNFWRKKGKGDHTFKAGFENKERNEWQKLKSKDLVSLAWMRCHITKE